MLSAPEPAPLGAETPQRLLVLNLLASSTQAASSSPAYDVVDRAIKKLSQSTISPSLFSTGPEPMSTEVTVSTKYYTATVPVWVDYAVSDTAGESIQEYVGTVGPHLAALVVVVSPGPSEESRRSQLKAWLTEFRSTFNAKNLDVTSIVICSEPAEDTDDKAEDTDAVEDQQTICLEAGFYEHYALPLSPPVRSNGNSDDDVEREYDDAVKEIVDEIVLTLSATMWTGAQTTNNTDNTSNSNSKTSKSKYVAPDWLADSDEDGDAGSLDFNQDLMREILALQASLFGSKSKNTNSDGNKELKIDRGNMNPFAQESIDDIMEYIDKNGPTDDDDYDNYTKNKEEGDNDGLDFLFNTNAIEKLKNMREHALNCGSDTERRQLAEKVALAFGAYVGVDDDDDIEV